MQSGIKELGLTQFSDLTSTCKIWDIFYNSMVTKFCWLDVSLCFNVFDSNTGLSPSVFKNGTSGYKNKVKILVNIPGHILDLYCIRLSNASPFRKNYASFILIQNTFLWLNKGLNFSGLFQKSALFHINVSFLANIERCPKFLEYALHALICSKKSYICKWTKMTCWKVEVLDYNNSSSCRMKPYIFLWLPWQWSFEKYIMCFTRFFKSVYIQAFSLVSSYKWCVKCSSLCRQYSSVSNLILDWLKVNKEKQIFSFGAFSIDLFPSQLNNGHY